MKNYRVLIVDDEQSVRDTASTALPSHVIAHTASSLESAREKIRENFYHDAFVDLQLALVSENSDGFTVLRELHDYRPTCRRILLTSHVGTAAHRERMIELFDPTFPIAQAIVDKNVFNTSTRDIVIGLADEWAKKVPSNIEGLEELQKQLIGRYKGGNNAQVTAEEIEHLFWSFLDKTAELRSTPGLAKYNASLTLLKGGRSRSSVALLKLSDSNLTDPVQLVAKIGPKDEIKEEFSRYRQFVQLLLKRNKKVELFDAVIGDTIGALFYSFVGDHSGMPTDLTALMEKEDASAIAYIRQICDPNSKIWYRKVRGAHNIARFFSNVYRTNGITAKEDVLKFFEVVAGKYGGNVRKDGESLIFPGGKVTFPTKLLTEHLRSEYQECIVHGDLNPSNVLLSTLPINGTVADAIAIDFRYTGWGPVALDFATLLACVRLNALPRDATIPELLKVTFREVKLLEILTPDRSLAFQERDGSPLEYWETLSTGILGLLRENFPDTSTKQLLETFFLTGLRFFQIKKLNDHQKMRLVVWICAAGNKALQIH